MSQHFLLSSKAKTLRLADVLRMTEQEAETAFCKIRWFQTEGEPVCPHCGGLDAYSLNGACTNWAESYFARLRRGEAGHHHHIAGAYLLRYAQEAAWREDNRRVTNGEQTRRVAQLALSRKPSVDFSGYWQRHIETA